jgi:hypothetical protein
MKTSDVVRYPMAMHNKLSSLKANIASRECDIDVGQTEW